MKKLHVNLVRATNADNIEHKQADRVGIKVVSRDDSAHLQHNTVPQKADAVRCKFFKPIEKIAKPLRRENCAENCRCKSSRVTYRLCNLGKLQLNNN